MSLTACLIARNEAANLPRALASVQTIADEIIVVDTGSADDTTSIAAAHGARVFDFPWCDDFAAAHNYCHSKATGDWILWIDADEQLLDGGADQIRPVLSDPHVLAVWLARQDLVDLDYPEQFTEMWLMRLFRRRPDLQIVGRCHPEFRPSLPEVASAEGLRIASCNAKLRHFGYTAGLRPAKLQRAARLLDLELRDRPGNLYYLIEYARTLLALSDSTGDEVLAQAVDQMLRYRHDPRPPIPLVAALIEFLLASPQHRESKSLSETELEELALRWFPAGVPLLWVIAQRAFAASDFQRAAVFLERILKLRDTDSYDKSCSFDPRIMGDDLLLNLGVCWVRLAELDKAENLFQSLSQSGTRRTQAKKNLAAIHQIRRQH